jgi:3-oxoacyl-(acyl-carrier-protein) synthase
VSVDGRGVLCAAGIMCAHTHRLMISSPKSMAGHLTSAAAALNLLAALGAIRHGMVPPTINLAVPGRGLDLDYVPRRGATRLQRRGNGGVGGRAESHRRGCRRR